jgi:hypothetical protein
MSNLKNSLQVNENLNRHSAFRKSDDFDWQLIDYSKLTEIFGDDFEVSKVGYRSFVASYWQTSALVAAAMFLTQQQLNAVAANPTDNSHVYFKLGLDSNKINNPSASTRFIFHKVDTKPIGVTDAPKVKTADKSADKAELEIIFNGLVKTWKEGTSGFSITTRRYAHGSYQAILVLGPDVVPLILRELQNRPDWWFEALKALTKADPTKPTDNFHDAVKAWLRWGKEQKPPLIS